MRLAPALLWVAASAGCVSKTHYDECIADDARVRADAVARQRDDAARLQGLAQQLSYVQAAVQERDAKLVDLSTASHNVQAQLDEATAINQQLRGELQRLGTDVDKMLAERGTLAKALDDAKFRLQELRKAQAVAEGRAQIFRDFQQRFKPLIDAGQIRIDSRRGELVMNVQGDLLFDQGRSELRSAGKGALMEIARAIETTSPRSSHRRFLVTADSDGVEDKELQRPSHRTKASPSSWTLTAARSVSVVEFLVSVGVPETSLIVAAAGSFDPWIENERPENRALNRRIEFALLPSEDSTPPAPTGQSAVREGGP